MVKVIPAHYTYCCHRAAVLREFYRKLTELTNAMNVKCSVVVSLFQRQNMTDGG